jgi:hypothetical protein
MFSNATASLVSSLSSSSLLLLGALALGCGDDAGGSKDAGTPPGGDGAVAQTLVTYNGTLVPILAVDTTAPVAVPHLIELLDNTTGQPLVPPVSTMSVAGTGAIALTGPRGQHIMYVHGTGTGSEGTTDTVLLNADVDIHDPLIRISTAGLGPIAGQTGGFTEVPDRAALTGAVYWLVDNKRMGTIGCAKVYLDGLTAPDTDSGQLYTGASGLPVPLSMQSQTLKTGVFYFANIKPGAHTMKVSLDEGKTFIGEETKFYIPFPRSQAKSETKAVLAQLAFYVRGPSNPTPSTCTQ